MALRSQHRDRLSAIESLARSECALNIEALDSDPWALNCTNGTVDLRDGSLRPHRREDYISHVCPVRFDAGAACPRWLLFLEEVLPNPAVRAYLQRLLGYSITGDVREQLLPIACGDGNNGKSVMLDTVSDVVGPGYATEAPPELLTTRKGGSEHPTEIADLKGRRLVVASENEKEAKLRLQLIKRLTGNARLKGRLMHRDFFEFNRTHKLILVTNHLPAVTENTEAIWRRVRLIRFEIVVPVEQRDKGLMGTLRNEHPGILAWLVRGAVDWFKNGLREPQEVMLATESYRAGSDDFGRFMAATIRRDPRGNVSASLLLQRYQEFCAINNIEILKGPPYGDALRRAGLVPDRRKSAGQSERVWRGGTLR